MDIPNSKPLYEQLSEYLYKQNISGKKIAELFGYSQAAISEYVSGKRAVDSKLNIITSLYLELQALKEGKIALEEKQKYETLLYRKDEEIEELSMQIKKLEGYILGIKESKEELIMQLERKNLQMNSIIEENVQKAIDKTLKSQKILNK